MQKIELSKENAGANLRVESLPFDKIPGQSKLFLKYQSDPLSLRKFYPSVVSEHTEVAKRIPEVLATYRTDRDWLCDVLAEQNRGFGVGKKTLENINQLRQKDAVAVVTGQQAGLFGGPLYTVYKALSAIQMAQCLNDRGFNAVPVFWAATEDHDFDEIASAEVIGNDSQIRKVTTAVRPSLEGLPVGNVTIDSSIRKTIDELIDALPATEFSNATKALFEESYCEDDSFGRSFAKLIARLLSQYGLIVLDPIDERIKKLVSPIYSEAVEKADVIVDTLLDRNTELAEAGFHSQVLIEKDYYPLFWHDNDGARRSLKRDGELLHVTGTRETLSREDLVSAAAKEPQQLSPGVMLRPVVQDFLLPTVCYFGGSAEISYFGQNSEVYRVLERPVTPILHRQSFTIVESKHQRTLERFGLDLTDLFKGLDALLPDIVGRYLDPGTSGTIAEVEEKINGELNRLDQNFSEIDATLAANLATRRRKILYHISALYKKFQATQLRKNENADRQLRGAFASLLPHGTLQERSINAASFLDRHGKYFIDWVYESIDLDDKGHRIIYL